MNCYACNTTIVRGELIVCTSCSRKYHYGCNCITSAYFREHKRNLVESWVCSTCKISKTRDTAARNDSTPIRIQKSPQKASMNTSNMNDTEALMDFEERVNNASNLQNRAKTNESPLHTSMIFENVTIRSKAIRTNVLNTSGSEHQNELTTDAIRDIVKEEVSLLIKHHNDLLLESLTSIIAKLVYKIDTLEHKIEQFNLIQPSINPEVAKSTNKGLQEELWINIENGARKPGPKSKPTQRIETEDSSKMGSPASTAQNPGHEEEPHKLDGDDGDNNVNSKEDEWILVNNKKKERKSFRTNVLRGVNNQLMSMQAIESKKFLHVWSLHPETSNEAVSQHVAKICGMREKDVSVERIVPKTKRDYASFKIGVVESQFGKIFRTESWPVNTRLSEWVFFRTFHKTSNQGKV